MVGGLLGKCGVMTEREPNAGPILGDGPLMRDRIKN